MGKLILFLIIAGAIYFFFIKKPAVEEKQKEESEDLVMCDKCKTFYPKNEIKKVDGKNICKDCYANS
ncbi:PP0621 family protein [Caminibacter pacificus]|jgi:formylmethanofuran dehydrogenase subunit E|uniref:Glucose-inhibited division protein B n=1 Tax=Caminibacter pacificus TaxID=1424653 RepID=A0AAJ4RC01_9BACT|nr:PP0621 family protein [Caminibacter pacificus]NPA88402.1 glucose-inhibited division protein B [Campylobacterota bacterium]QCI28788.1 glucose-inhibited division protein B [Caminibacter pacificus]ROR39376.1 hypothetical protein EDC58_1316 [Caminibacter pacificus]